MAEKLYFSYGEISSDTINETIQRHLTVDHNIETALKLVKGFTNNNQQTEEQKTCMAYDILNGKAKIVGTYPKDDYGVEYPEDCADKHNLTDILQHLAQQIEDKQKELNELQRKYIFVCEDLSDYKRRELHQRYRETYDENLFHPESLNLPNSRVQEFLDIAKSDDEEYGWLEPNGTFHPVGWAKHAEWAKDYLSEHYPMKENPELYWSKEEKIPIYADEVLTRKLHWILLHNPYQGKANISMNINTTPTKAQKEFLYDYLTKRGRTEEANNIYKNEG